VIDACAVLGRTGIVLPDEWRESGGAGVIAGLLDTSFDHGLRDLAGADLVVRNFTGGRPSPETEHGTHSAALLVGQGRDRFRGLAPRARLLLAEVVGVHGVASLDAVAEAIDWLVAAGAQIVALPLGSVEGAPVIERSLDRATAKGLVLFGASGHEHLEGQLFPARHPAVVGVAASPTARTAGVSRLVIPVRELPAPVSAREVAAHGGSSVACVIASGIAVLAQSAGAVDTEKGRRRALLEAVGSTLHARATSPPAIRATSG
jgi:subtilisin family serine protease